MRRLESLLKQFVVRDLRQVSVVDDAGFLNLLAVAEPRYAVPSHSTINREIDELYVHEKYRVKTAISSAEFMCCTTDM